MTALKIIAQACALTALAAAIGIGTNLLRPGGIPLVTDIPYEIFAPCKDSEATSQAVSGAELSQQDEGETLYIDARPAEMYAAEHIVGAINVPYSALYGASDDDLLKAKKAVEKQKPTAVIVYGAYADPADPNNRVDFGKPLAQQLVEAEIAGVRHVPGGLSELNKSGLDTVKQGGDNK